MVKTSRISNKICPEGMTIEEWQRALRHEQAELSDFAVEHLDENRIWGDYLVHSGPGRYKVAFRGVYSDRNFCSCLDFRTNGLGTCKHLEAVTIFLQKTVPGYPWAGINYLPPYTSVYVSYKGGRSIRMRIGTDHADQFLQVFKRYFDADGILPKANFHLLSEIQEACTEISPQFRMYDDVLEFAREETQLVDWQRALKNAYEDERIPWGIELGGAHTEELERALYALCYQSNGLIIAPKHPMFMHLVARLAEEVYEGELHPQPGYIIVDTEVERRQWEAVLRTYSGFSQLPIDVILASQFIERVTSAHPAVTFMWVNNARGLRDWQNELSLAIKKLSVSHIYMHLETLLGVTPIQLSSTLQHINPYVMGPLYKFVHGYRHTFPLLDDGSNTPNEIKAYLFFLSSLCDQVVIHTTESTLGARLLSAEDKVRALLEILQDIASDPEAMNLLKKRLD